MDTVLLALAAVLTAATGWCGATLPDTVLLPRLRWRVLLVGVGGFAGVVRALIRLYD